MKTTQGSGSNDREHSVTTDSATVQSNEDHLNSFTSLEPHEEELDPKYRKRFTLTNMKLLLLLVFAFIQVLKEIAQSMV